MLSLEPLATMMGLANVDPVLEEVGEGAIGEGGASPIFGDLGVATFGDDFLPIKLSDELAERSQLQVEAEDGSYGLGLGFIDNELLSLAV